MFTRRYFYPLISQIPTYKGLQSGTKGELHVAEEVTKEILCLRVFPDPRFDDVDFTVENIRLCRRDA